MVVVTKPVADVKGVKLAGLLFDAGILNSPVLLQVGTKKACHRTGATDMIRAVFNGSDFLIYPPYESSTDHG